VLLSIAAALYARQKHVAPAIAIPVAAAFLIEYIFYLVPGFESFRERFAGRHLSLSLVISALIPYLVYSLPTHQFSALSFLMLLIGAALVAYWYAIFPAVWWADLLFVFYLAAVILSGILKAIYASPIPRVYLDIMGHLMLVHTGAMVMLLHRRIPGIGFGFIPSAREFWIGARNFLFFAPFGAVAGWWLGVFHYRGLPVWQGIGIFFGVLWMIALSEEFAFRGIVQQTLARVTSNKNIARIIASLCFGSVHFWYPGGFPNWRMALLASIAGWFYGKAFDEAGSIRAAMVAHAITDTVWKVWLA
jgi:membrane protease YdiL (CAAX protease family)